MPVVPMSRSASRSPMLNAEKPSDSNLLMAAAEMHKLGRLAPTPDVDPPQTGTAIPSPMKRKPR